MKLNHRGDRCTFEAIIEDYRLHVPGLERLALIVRSADIKGQEHVAPEGIGLRHRCGPRIPRPLGPVAAGNRVSDLIHLVTNDW